MKTAGDDILAETNEDTPVDDILNCFNKAVDEGTKKYVPTRFTKAKERPPWTRSSGSCSTQERRKAGRRPC